MKKPMTKRQAFNAAQKAAKKQIREIEKQIKNLESQEILELDSENIELLKEIRAKRNLNLNLKKKLSLLQNVQQDLEKRIQETQIKISEEKQKLFEQSKIHELSNDEKNQAIRQLIKKGILKNKEVYYMDFLYENEEQLDYEDVKEKTEQYQKNQQEISDYAQKIRENPMLAFR